MKEIIKVDLYKDCIPQKGIWYDHHGTIFISVMRKSTPYIKRKNKFLDSKKDNELSEWHREWQYDIIESKYGFEQYREKSYERTVKYENNLFRIDSVVENLAIEFQHTLSVGIDEMNKRFEAHKNSGFVPYLVIDMSSYSYERFEKSINYSWRNSIKTIFEKWIKSKYALENNLFIDLEDKILRFVHSYKNSNIIIEKNDFSENLLQQEYRLNEVLKLKELLKLRADRKEKIKLRKLQLKEIFIQQEAEEKKKIEREEKLAAQKRKKEKEYQRYLRNKFENEEFKYYRKCFTNKLILPYVKPYDNEIFEYSTFTETEEEENLLIKYHYYNSKNSKIEIRYLTYTEFSVEETIVNNRYGKKKRKYNYLKSEIEIKSGYKTLVKFKWLKGQNIKKVNDENELLLF